MLKQKNNYKNYFILFAGITLLLLIVFVQLSQSLALTNGKFIYPLDDTYLHMAIAKNIVQHGVWGITKYGFSSTSSSAFYTLLLSSCFYIFGVNDLVPLMISISTGVLVLFIVAYIAIKENIKSTLFLLLLLAIIFITPLPVLMLSGMEHTIHICLVISFTYLSTKFLSKTDIENSKEKKHFFFLVLLSFLLVLLRYESLFLVGIVSVLFLLKKRFTNAFIILFAGVLPVVVYGFISMGKGSLFLPNTIALKGGRQDLQENIIIYYAYNWFRRMFFDLHLLSLFLMQLSAFSFAYFRSENFWNRYVLMLFITFSLFIAHLMFASVGWLYRYEAYLVAQTIFSLFLFINSLHYNKLKIDFRLWPAYLALAFLLLTISYPLIKRSYYAFTKTVVASKNIHDQQYQMSRFVKKYYPEKSVAANDIGCIIFYTEAKVLDLAGLGSLDVLKLKLNNNFNAESLKQLAEKHNVEVVMLYEKWLGGNIPQHWKKAGEWEIKDNVITADKTVAFYAVDDKSYDELIQHFSDFKKEMPEDVFVRVEK